MPSNRRAGALVLGVCVVLLACKEPSRGPVAPDPISSPASLADASLLLPFGGNATGHADIHGTVVQNIRDETYSFTAMSTDAFPLAKGQVEVHFVQFTGEEFTVHAEVTCVSVLGNQAWVGSRVTRFVVDGQELAGDRRMIFRVQDNGEGHGTTDLASLVFFGVPPGGDLTHCNTRPAFPVLRESTNGNIHVKPN